MKSLLAWGLILACVPASAELNLKLYANSVPAAKSSVSKALGAKGQISKIDGNWIHVSVDTDTPRTTFLEMSKLPGVRKAFAVKPAKMLPFYAYKGVAGVRAATDRQTKLYSSYYRALHGDKTNPTNSMVPDRFHAYLYNWEQRAYPYNDIPWDKYTEAETYRQTMKPTEPDSAGGLMAAIGLAAQGAGGWQFMGPKNLSEPHRIFFGIGPVSGRIGALAYDPSSPGTYYAGAPVGGVWKTTDAGVNWTPLGDNWPRISVGALVVKSDSPNTILAGTGDQDGNDAPGIGVMKSTDGGLTWNLKGAAEFGGSAIRRMVADPSNPDVVVAASSFGNPNFLYRSTDAGETWSPVSATREFWNDVVVGPADANGVRSWYATASGNGPGRVYRSTNGGQTWTQITTLPIGAGFNSSIDVGVSPLNGNTVYVMVGSADAVYKSTDAGGTWTALNLGPAAGDFGQAFYDYYVDVSSSGTNDVVYIGLVDVYQSRDGGTTFASLANGFTNQAIIHVDHHVMAVNPSDPSEVLFGSDGGVFRMTNGNSSPAFATLNKTLGVTQFYHAAFHPSDERFMIGGTQDNSSPAAIGDLLNWRNPATGDGGGAGISQQNPAVQVNTSQFYGMRMTTNFWNNSFNVTPNLGGENVPFIGEVLSDPTNGSRVFIGTNFLHRLDTTSRQWTMRIGNQDFGSNATITAMMIAPSDGSRMYVGTSRGLLWMTQNGGTTWSNITGTGLPNRNLTDIDVDPTDPSNVVVTFSGFNTGHVFRNSNVLAGSNWTDLNGSGPDALPNIPTNTVALDPTNTSRLFVGTDIGVFASEDNGATWTDATTPLGLPNTRVTELAIQPQQNAMYAATYGRGIWKIDLSFASRHTVTVNPQTVLGGTQATAEIRVEAPSDVDQTFTISTNPPGLAIAPSQATIPAGATSTTFTINTISVTSLVTATVSVAGEAGVANDTFDIRPLGLVAPLEIWPGRPVGGNLVYGRVRLEAPAPAGGASIFMFSSRPDLAEPTRNWILVPEGQTSVNYTVNTFSVDLPTTVNIFARRGSQTITNDILIQPIGIANFTAPTTTLTSGQTVRVRINLDGPAPAGGLKVRFSTSNGAIIVPSVIAAPAGFRFVETNFRAGTVTSPTTVTVEARRLNSVKTLTFTINP